MKKIESELSLKIFRDPNKLANILSVEKNKNEKIVMTNGCFDLIHRGHLEYLIKASEFGTKFLVVINSDQSVSSLKGNYRPIQNENDRSFLLACLSFVDYVLISSGPDKRLLKEFTPLPIDVYVKGGDYSIDRLDPQERQLLQAKNCQFKFIPFIQGHSTTELIHKIIMSTD
jgi:rfaE bifunctional protein nucleotidyltransferase chain/domain